MIGICIESFVVVVVVVVAFVPLFWFFRMGAQDGHLSFHTAPELC